MINRAEYPISKDEIVDFLKDEIHFEENRGFIFGGTRKEYLQWILEFLENDQSGPNHHSS